MNVLLVPAHPGFPGQIPQSRKTVVCVCVISHSTGICMYYYFNDFLAGIFYAIALCPAYSIPAFSVVFVSAACLVCVTRSRQEVVTPD